MDAILFSVVCASVLASIHVHGQVAAPSFLGPGNPSKSCKFEFVVPDKNGACSKSSADLDLKINQLKQDLDRTRLQYISQNSLIQGEMTKLQSLRGSLDHQVSDLMQQFRELKHKMDVLPVGNSASADLQKSVMDTKDYFIKVMHDIENKIFTLSNGVQKEAIEQSKINAAIEAQMTEQVKKTKETESKMKNMENLIQILQTNPGTGTTSGSISTSGTVSPASSAALKILENKLNDLEQKMNTMNSKQKGDIEKLEKKTNQTESMLGDHNRQLSDLSMQMNMTSAKMDTVLKTSALIRETVIDFRRKNEPKIQNAENEAARLFKTVDKLQHELITVATDVKNGVPNVLKDEHSIQNLKTLTELLMMKLKSVTQKLQKQDQIEKAVLDLQNQIKTLVSSSGSSPVASHVTNNAAVPTVPSGKKVTKFPVPPLLHHH